MPLLKIEQIPVTPSMLPPGWGWFTNVTYDSGEDAVSLHLHVVPTKRPASRLLYCKSTVKVHLTAQKVLRPWFMVFKHNHALLRRTYLKLLTKNVKIIKVSKFPGVWQIHPGRK